MNTVRSSNIRAFLHSEELRGRLSAISTTNISTENSAKTLNFNLQKESNRYKLNLKNKNKKNKIRATTYEFALIPKKDISTIPKKGTDL